MNYEKCIRDGKVAVLYSPGFGAGWYTWNSNYEFLLFDKDLVEALEAGDTALLMKLALQKMRHQKKLDKREYSNIYFGGIEYLTIAWIPVGTKFIIDEYDGAETVKTIDDYCWTIA